MTNQQRRSIKIWQVLIACASSRQTITAMELAGLIGELSVLTPNVVSHRLGPISAFCDKRGLPNLALLVVHRTTGAPSVGIGMSLADVNHEREQVFQTPWFSLEPPSPDEF